MGAGETVKSAAAIQGLHPSRNTTLAADLNSGSRVAEISPSIAIQAVLLDIIQTFGVSFVPDLFMGMSDRPAYLEAAWELFKEDLGLDSLDYRTKRIIALAITTNETGTYYIAADPQAFRLHALDHAICERLLFTIRLFNAFDRYLSGVSPAHVPKTTRVVINCLREEFLSYGAASPSEGSPRREEDSPVASWIVGILIISLLLLPIAAGIYLFLR